MFFSSKLAQAQDILLFEVSRVLSSDLKSLKRYKYKQNHHLKCSECCKYQHVFSFELSKVLQIRTTIIWSVQRAVNSSKSMIRSLQTKHHYTMSEIQISKKGFDYPLWSCQTPPPQKKGHYFICPDFSSLLTPYDTFCSFIRFKCF